jgi:hypothetical protein
MADDRYESKGTPLKAYQLTRRDHGWQRTLEQIQRDVPRWVAESRAAQGLPPTIEDPAVLDKIAAMVVETMTDPHLGTKLMRWRVRLYCGHIVETERHREFRRPTDAGSGSMRCPVCGLDPAAIVAYEPVGIVAELDGGGRGR